VRVIELACGFWAKLELGLQSVLPNGVGIEAFEESFVV